MGYWAIWKLIFFASVLYYLFGNYAEEDRLKFFSYTVITFLFSLEQMLLKVLRM
tara:strand:+ start:301 stop:462 length:162 start_codon:yes stop_codon:yes gene_type:complete